MLNTCQRYQQPFRKFAISNHLKQALNRQATLNFRAAAIHSTTKICNSKESKVVCSILSFFVKSHLLVLLL